MRPTRSLEPHLCSAFPGSERIKLARPPPALQAPLGGLAPLRAGKAAPRSRSGPARYFRRGAEPLLPLVALLLPSRSASGPERADGARLRRRRCGSRGEVRPGGRGGEAEP